MSDDQLTLARLREMKERAEAATRGPWARGPQVRGQTPDVVDAQGQIVHYGLWWDDGDADFIAHARNDVPALLDALDGIIAFVRYGPQSVRQYLQDRGSHPSCRLILELVRDAELRDDAPLPVREVEGEEAEKGGGT